MSVIYTTPARDVVPGILVEIRPGGGDWVTLRKVGRDDTGLLVWMYGGGTRHLPPGYPTDVRLPDTSPRALCCRCCAHGCELEDDRASAPELHAVGCPVAPVTGVHGGMRIWPAPVKGRYWTTLPGCYVCGDIIVWLTDIRWCGKHGVQGLQQDSHRARDEMVLQLFFLPPTPPEPTGDRAAWEAARARKGYR